MITHIKTKGFKGQDIDEDIYPKTLFVGPNGSGKSTRAHAVALVVLGYVPWAAKAKKKPADILAAYGSGKSLTVAITINGMEFERHIVQYDSGKTSQRYRIDKAKYSATDFAVELSKAGDPKILDVSAFMELSDQKKIDTIFHLYPPAGDVKDIDAKIEKKTDEINRLNRTTRGYDSVVQRLSKSKGDIEIPGGSLAEVQADIESLTADIKQAQEDLKQAEIEAARVEAEEKERARAKVEAEKKAETVRVKEEKKSDPIPSVIRDVHNANLKRVKDFVSGGPSPFDRLDPVQSIQSILDTLEAAGCGACAAKLVAKRELMKFRKETAA